MAVCLGHRVPSSFRMPLLSFPAFTDPLLERIPIRLGKSTEMSKRVRGNEGEVRSKGKENKREAGDRNTSHTSPRGDLLPDIAFHSK